MLLLLFRSIVRGQDEFGPCRLYPRLQSHTLVARIMPLQYIVNVIDIIHHYGSFGNVLIIIILVVVVVAAVVPFRVIAYIKVNGYLGPIQRLNGVL